MTTLNGGGSQRVTRNSLKVQRTAGEDLVSIQRQAQSMAADIEDIIDDNLTHSPLPRPQPNRYTSHTKHLHLAPLHAFQSRHARQMLQNVLYRLAHLPQQTPR